MTLLITTPTKTKKIIKSFGYYEDFDINKLKAAIDTALEFSDEELSNKIMIHVLSHISENETVLSSYINDLIERYLLNNLHTDILIKYIENRYEKQLAFTKKIEYLGDDLVSSPNFNREELKDFDVNQIQIAATRYLLRDMETGKIKESMSQWFMRVARAVVLGSVVYDSEVYDKEDLVLKQSWTGQLSFITISEIEVGILQRLYKKLEKHMKLDETSFLIAVDHLLHTEKYTKLVETYYKYMYNGIFEPNTPTLMNAGTISGKCSACFTLDVEDTMISISDKWVSSALIFQGGGGLGVNISKVRPVGSNIGTTYGAATGGIALVLEMIDAVTEKVKSGGKRRGANMGIMEYNHPDIDQFITMKKTPGVLENFNVSVMFDAAFWEYYSNNNSYPLQFGGITRGQKNAREFMQTIAESAWSSAEPGVLFMDNANIANPLQPLRGDIRITNPCVTGNTRLNTEFGVLTMEELYEYGKPVLVGVDVIHESNVHKGRGKAKKPAAIETKKASKIYKTSDTAEVYRITTFDGYELEATEYHPVILKDGIPIKISELIPKVAKGEDCYIALQSNVGLFGNQGDESVGAIMGFAQNNYELIHHLATVKDEKSLYNIICAFDETYDQMTYYTKSNQTMVLSHKQDIKQILEQMQPNTVPDMMWKGTKECVKMYLRMIFDTAPPEQYKFEFNILRYSNTSKKFLKDLQLLLINFGVKTCINEQPDEKGFHTLTVPEQSFAHYLFKIGFRGSKNISKLMYNKYGHTDLKYNSRITKIEKLEGLHKVYDAEEFDTHKLTFNGIVTGNCSEQYMYDGESCTLGSINLAKLIDGDHFDWINYKEAIRNTTRFLNDVLEINVYPTEHIQQESDKSKRIGLGIMGLADALYKLKIPYNSEEGYEFMNQLSETLYIESVKTSIDLAEERGACEWYNKLVQSGFNPHDSIKRVYASTDELEVLLGDEYFKKLYEYGIRNMWTTTVAPTGTISMIAGCSSGLEPIFSLVFSKTTRAGNYYYTNEEFKKALIKEGIYSPELLKKVENNYGSCRGLDEIPEWIQKTFVTAIDLHWVDHVVAQAVWQEWIDNSISKTINMPHNVTIEDVKNAYILAHKLGLKGISMYRDGSRQEQVLHVGSNATSMSNESFSTETKVRKNILYPSLYARDYIKSKDVELIREILENIKEQEIVVEQETCKSCGLGVMVEKEGCTSCNKCGAGACAVG